MRRNKKAPKRIKADTKGKAAIGCRVHSGWAALVVVAGPIQAPVIIDRRRIVNADNRIPGSKQPYHHVEMWPLPKAQGHIDRCTRSTKIMTEGAFGTLVEEMHAKGQRVIGFGLLTASGRPVPSLADALASHAMLHTAECEFYRNALIEASQDCGIPVTRLKEKELLPRAKDILGLAQETLPARLVELGREMGPPWSQDEKLAALAAWMVLAETAKLSPCSKRKK